jgi:hypothetical protein
MKIQSLIKMSYIFRIATLLKRNWSKSPFIPTKEPSEWTLDDVILVKRDMMELIKNIPIMQPSVVYIELIDRVLLHDTTKETNYILYQFEIRQQINELYHQYNKDPSKQRQQEIFMFLRNEQMRYKQLIGSYCTDDYKYGPMVDDWSNVNITRRCYDILTHISNREFDFKTMLKLETQRFIDICMVFNSLDTFVFIFITDRLDGVNKLPQYQRMKIMESVKLTKR